MQRSYAFAVFLLRDFFRLSPFDQLSQWKAQVTMSLSQLCLVGAVVLTTSAAVGRLVVVARSETAFLTSAAVLTAGLYLANGYAERRLLPLFEHDYRLLTRTQRIAGMVVVVLVVALTVVAALASAAAVRGLR
jgi:hypothetical protein